MEKKGFSTQRRRERRVFHIVIPAKAGIQNISNAMIIKVFIMKKI
jgi:hypothetical protein